MSIIFFIKHPQQRNSSGGCDAVGLTVVAKAVQDGGVEAEVVEQVDGGRRS
ncbi:hypothetical protein HanIR_Chr06g0286021 [Helianthus annuus]|nr:hypothetical protein HanIR_Chr06g0286021 [Helianthus annuus]